MDTLLEGDELKVSMIVIGKLKPRCKLGVVGEITIHPSSTFLEKWMTRIKRTVLCENKHISYAYICTCLKSIQHYVQTLKQTNDMLRLCNFQKLMEDMQVGIQNYALTYEHNVNMHAKIMCTIDNLKLLHEEIELFLQKTQLQHEDNHKEEE